MSTSSPSLEAALRYASEGWAVLRVRAGTKVPAEIHGKNDATGDPAELERRFTGWEGNVGIVPPHDKVVVDIDKDEALAELRARGYSLPATAWQRTPRGRHLVYALPEGVGARQTVGEICAGVDTRTASGYILTAPSPGYIWVVPLQAQNVALAPEWLIDRLAPLVPRLGRPNDRTEVRWHIASDRPDVAMVREGGRNSFLASVIGHLARRDVFAALLPALAQGLNAVRCEPPLDQAEVDQITESIVSRELQRRRAW